MAYELTVMLIRCASAFDSSIYSDVTVHCQDKVFSVHKVILASQSPFFAAMLKDFKVNADARTSIHNRHLTCATQEGKSNIIELPDSEDDELVKAVLRFMYGKPLEIPSDYNAAPFLANLYGKADYYQLPALKQGMIMTLDLRSYAQTLETDTGLS